MKNSTAITTLVCAVHFTLFGLSGWTSAAILIQDFDPILEDFQAFAGAGFSPSPAAGQLDSDDYAPHGFSDGDLNFGDTGTTGDYARGASAGGVTTGGAYAFDVGGGNVTLGVQPTGGDFTPGALYVKYQNKTGGDLAGVEISAVGWYIDNASRSSTYGFGLSVSDQDLSDPSSLVYLSDPSLSYDTPEGPASAPVWVPTNLGSTVLIPVPDDHFIYLRVLGDDLAGSGSRDEASLDNLQLTAIPIPEPSSLLLIIAALAGLLAFRCYR